MLAAGLVVGVTLLLVLGGALLAVCDVVVDLPHVHRLVVAHLLRLLGACTIQIDIVYIE